MTQIERWIIGGIGVPLSQALLVFAAVQMFWDGQYGHVAILLAAEIVSLIVLIPKFWPRKRRSPTG